MDTLTPQEEERALASVKAATEREPWSSNAGPGDHGASGYFLAVSGRLSAPLVERLETLRENGSLAVVDWWERTEFEDELRAAPEILDRYSDIVRPA